MPVPRPRSAMRKIREILRLVLGEGLSVRQAAAATRVPASTVADQLARAGRAGLGWPLPDDLDDAQLEARLFGPAAPPRDPSRPMPDWAGRPPGAAAQGRDPAAALARVPRAPSRRLRLHLVLPRATGPGRAGSTWSCARSTGPARSCSSTSRARPSRSSTRDTGEVWQAAALRGGARAPATTPTPRRSPSQALPDWIGGARPRLRVLRGLSARSSSPTTCAPAVTRAHRYEPDLNRTYEEMAAHYGAVGHPRAAPEAPGQGEGGGRRPARRALDPGGAAQPHVLQPRRGERRDPRARSTG